MDTPNTTDRKKDCCNCNNYKCPNSPHFWWIIAIAIVIIVFLLAWALSKGVFNGEKIKTFITDAGLLLSITLSIFAIAYTYTSNNNTSRQFEKINNAAERIVDTAHRITESQIALNQQTKRILDEIDEIKRDTHNISDKVMKNDNKDLPPSKDFTQPSL